MSEFTLKIRRYLPETGEAAFWQEYTVDLEGHRSVLEAILTARAEQDGSIGIRCSCQAAICGSCAVRINGKTRLACNTKIGQAAEEATHRTGLGEIIVEPMAKNTAAAIALAAHRLPADAVMLVCPSDHHIADVGAFREAASAARSFVSSG